VGKFVNEDAAQNSTIHDFFKVTHKELNKKVSKSVPELNKEVLENISGVNNQEPGDNKQSTYLEDMDNGKGSTAMDNDKGRKSSTSGSFFMNYLKQHNVVKSAEVGSGKASVGTSENRSPDSIDHPISKHVHGIDSDSDMFDSPVADTEEVLENKSDVHLQTTKTNLNVGASTSVTTEHVNDTTKMWVSIEELFPDINSVDEDVVALLPSPLQKRLHSQIENAKHSSRISNKRAVSTFTMAGDSKLIDAPDCLFVGGRTKCEAEELTEVVKVSTHVDDCVLESEREKQLCRGRKVFTALNQVGHSEDEKDYIISKSCHVLQVAKEESSNLMQVCNDIIPPEAARASTGIAGHSKANASCGVTSMIHGMSESSDIQDTSNVVAEICPHCKKAILLSEYPEHLDFHTAEKLHEELNGREVQIRTAVSSTSTRHKKPPLDLTTKRKRGPLSKKLSVTDRDKKVRTITTFFTPK
jgi:hypothetical protein